MTTRRRPPNWRQTKLKDVCFDVTVGHVGPMASQYVETGIPFLRSQNIEPFRLNRNDIKYISEEFHAKLKKSALKPGDVAVVRTGYPGTACVIPLDLPMSNCADLVIIRPSNQIISRYLVAIFNSAWGRGAVAGNLVGVAQQHFNIGAAKELVIDLPPITTQRKIASILSAYDDLIENNTRRIAILEAMAQAIYREWFVEFRFPGHEKVKLVNSPLGKIPEGWTTLALNALCSRITDGSHRSPKSVNVGLPMASMKDMDDWGLDLSECRYISSEDFADLVKNDCKPKVGDVLIAKDGASYLKYMFVVEKEIEVVLLSSIAVLRPNGRLLPHLLTFILRDPQIKGRLANYVTGAAIPRVILKDFARFQIVVPSESLQTLWWSNVQPIVGLIHGLRNKNINLLTTRDLLLPKLISGQLDVEDLDIGEAVTE